MGIEISSRGDLKNRSLGRLFVDNFKAYGKAHYTIDFAKQSEEFLCITPFAHNKGKWYLDQNLLVCECDDETSSYSGNYFAKDITVKATVNPIHGESHNLILRAQGIMRGYYLGFSNKNEIAIYKNEFGFEKLISTQFVWENNKTYELEAKAIDNQLQLTIDGKTYLKCRDDAFKYGMFGLGSIQKGKSVYGNIEIRE